jgi:alpha-ketoglutarate-dependent 2,4-dichlorophenoxyacetate dioxygenase
MTLEQTILLNNTPFHCRRLDASFGVELSGAQLRDNLDEESTTAVMRLIAEHLLVVFRGQELTEAEQDAIVLALGQQRDQGENAWVPPSDPNAVVGEAHPTYGMIPFVNKGNVLFFVNGPGLCEDDPTAVFDPEHDNTKGGASAWHTGDTEKFNYEVVNVWQPIVTPGSKGNTLFSDTTAGFADLPEDMQRTFEQLRAIHTLLFPPEAIERFNIPPSTPLVSQPLVKQNPVTGRKHFYTNFNFMDRIIGYSREQSYKTLKFLFEHLTQPKYVYSHQWTNGDLVFLNCNGTMHKRGELDPTTPRALRRSQVSIPALQSVREWDKSWQPQPGDHDGEFWHPYPFQH